MPAKRTPERALEAMWDQEPKTLERAQRDHRQGGAAGARRHPGGVRRRPGPCRHRLRRRAAGRPGGPAGTALRGTCRQAPRQGHEGGRDRPLPGLSHQCGEALQIRAARQAPHPCEADRRRGEALPALADEGAGAGQAEARGGARRNGAPRAHRQVDADHPLARTRHASALTRATSPCTPPTCCACPTRRRSGRPTRLS